MRKLISVLLIFSMMNLAGCFYQKQMNPQKYNFDERIAMELTTKDTAYTLKGEDYYYENDSLTITLIKNLDDNSRLKYDIKIPAKEIEQVEVRKMDIVNTALIVGAITLIIALFVSFSQIGGDWSLQ